MLNGIVDLHVHSAPSLWPRRYTDPETWNIAQEAGVRCMVLKAHEGSTAERASLLGHGVVGGIVLNAPVGGANLDAVRVCADLGGRIVWMPTLSAITHIAASQNTELNVHRAQSFAEVPVLSDGTLRAEWYPVLDFMGSRDLVLGSGHLSMDETVLLFKAARERGISRLLVNHPLLAFLGWRSDHLKKFIDLGAYIEIGVLGDHLAVNGISPTEYFLDNYPHDQMVFGSDLGHQSFPEYLVGVAEWIDRFGEDRLRMILTKNGEELLSI
jgi:hypothetical protein